MPEEDFTGIDPIEIPPADGNYDDEYAHNPDGSIKLKKDGTPAKKRGRRSGTTSGPRLTSKGSLETQIGAMLWTINIPLQMVPVLQRDAMDAVEIQALAKAIDQQCQVSPTFRKYVEAALKAQGGTSLIAVVGIMGTRRALRHNIVPIPDEVGGPQAMDAMLGGVLSTIVTGKPINSQVLTPDAN